MLANLPNKGFYGAIIDDEIGKSLEFCHLTKMDKYHNIWMKSFPNELSHLAKGISDVPGIYTIDFIPQEEVPFGTTVTYGRIVCTYCPQKIEKHRTRLTVGGNMFICLYYVSDPTSDMTTAKMLFNSVISTPGECFITIDLKTSTSKPLCPNQGTRRQRLISYRMRSLKNTTCVTFSTTSMFISKSIWVCMEFMQQESWPTSSSRRDSTSMANINVNSPLASTVMCGAPSCSAWLLMILEWSSRESNMPNIWRKHWRNTTKLPLTERDVYFLASPSTGTITWKSLACPSLDMSREREPSNNMPIQKYATIPVPSATHPVRHQGAAACQIWH